MKQALAPVELKVAASSSVSVLVGVITWILVTYVPLFSNGLPPALATFLPWVISAVLAALSGWLAPHTPRPSPSSLTITAGPVQNVPAAIRAGTEFSAS